MTSPYLASVLRAVDKGKKINGEDVYKLNEAIFNIPEDETVDNRTALQVFRGAEKIMRAYTTGKYDTSDSDFFYDYVALLGTLQNQYFFDEKQNRLLLTWLAEAIGPDMKPPPAPPAPPQASKAESAKLTSLEKENSRLRAELDKLKDVSEAVMLLKSVKIPTLPSEKGKRKGKGKAKEEATEEKGKGKGKGKAKEEATEEKGKGKGKGKAKEEATEEKGKGKGKGKAKEEATEEEEGEKKKRKPRKSRKRGKKDAEEEAEEDED